MTTRTTNNTLTQTAQRGTDSAENPLFPFFRPSCVSVSLREAQFSHGTE
jgi:hypothetical protein